MLIRDLADDADERRHVVRGRSKVLSLPIITYESVLGDETSKLEPEVGYRMAHGHSSFDSTRRYSLERDDSFDRDATRNAAESWGNLFQRFVCLLVLSEMRFIQACARHTSGPACLGRVSLVSTPAKLKRAKHSDLHPQVLHVNVLLAAR